MKIAKNIIKMTIKVSFVIFVGSLISIHIGVIFSITYILYAVSLVTLCIVMA